MPSRDQAGQTDGNTWDFAGLMGETLALCQYFWETDLVFGRFSKFGSFLGSWSNWSLLQVGSLGGQMSLDEFSKSALWMDLYRCSNTSLRHWRNVCDRTARKSSRSPQKEFCSMLVYRSSPSPIQSCSEPRMLVLWFSLQLKKKHTPTTACNRCMPFSIPIYRYLFPFNSYIVSVTVTFFETVVTFFGGYVGSYIISEGIQSLIEF